MVTKAYAHFIAGKNKRLNEDKMTEFYIKIGAIVIGLLVILSSLVNIPSLVSKLILRKKSTVDTNVIPSVETKQDNQKEFLDIVSLWYQLKNKCDHFNLHVASEKLDEVFPLLNGVLEDEQVS
jgi:hypothetical protein